MRRVSRVTGLAACLGAALLAFCPGLAAQPDFEAAQAGFLARAEAERVALQAALVWTGDYASTVDGAFGRGTYNAILAFQNRARLPATGILDRPAEERLVAEAEAARQRVGFRLWNEPRSGVAVGAPMGMVPTMRQTPRGARLTGPNRRVEVEAALIPPGETSLEELHAGLAQARPDQAIAYTVRREGWFVVAGTRGAGEAARRRFYTRYRQDQDGLRGFTLLWDAKLSPGFDRVAVAMSNSFDSAEARAALTDVRKAFAARPATAAGGEARPAADPAIPAASPRVTGLGFAAGTGGHVLTALAAVAECRTLSSPGRGALRLVARDEAAGIALLQGDGPGPEALPLAAAPPAPGTDVVVMGGGEGAAGFEAAPGVVVAGAGDGLLVDAPLLPRGLGAPVLSLAGEVVGIGLARPDPKRMLAGTGVAPQAPLRVASASAALALLRQAGVTAEAGRPAAEAGLGVVAREASRALLPILCEP